MNKAPLHKHVKFVAKKSLRRKWAFCRLYVVFPVKNILKKSQLLYFMVSYRQSPLISFQPGHVYSGGATGLAQVLSALSVRTLGFEDTSIIDFLCD